MVTLVMALLHYQSRPYSVTEVIRCCIKLPIHPQLCLSIAKIGPDPVIRSF
jgi:hypothetical protein